MEQKMEKIKTINADDLGLVFREHIKDSQVYFVFSTDVVKNSWIDWIVLNPEESGVSAVPMERFIAWDTFKGEYVKGKEKGKSSVPGILRKFYVQDLIRKNALNPVFKKIINPEYKNEASSFTNWISKILPGLKKWYELRKTFPEPMDEEDQDYEYLYLNYKNFLEKNSMFEPSWLESDFDCKNNKFLIIFPELLEDFSDYEETLCSNENITLIKVDTEKTKNEGQNCYEYSDSRKELRRTLLQMRKLHQQGEDYQSMALIVPDLDTYKPYLEREFSKYCIPFVIRNGIPLLGSGEGSLFIKIQDCYNSNFSYDSVRALLLNDYIPWKESFSKERQSLIRLGKERRCLCSYKKDGVNVDIWEKALKMGGVSYDVEQLYSSVKKEVKKICEARSFTGILQAWEQFRCNFLEISDFTDASNKIISRSITHLKEFIQIEKEYFEPNLIQINKPYDFFITELTDKSYTPQNKTCGVNVYPYKLSAAAKIEWQFVIDASQNNLEIVYKPMAFLNSEKRKKLGLLEKDKKYNPSKAFITLYAKNPHKDAVTFSYAQNSFAGFSIAHNYMTLNKNKEPLAELDKDDFILNEKRNFLNQNVQAKDKITQAQKEQFIDWYEINKKRFSEDFKKDDELSPEIQNLIKDKLINHRIGKQTDPDPSKNIITQSDLKTFYECPRKWIFSRLLGLKEDSLDLSLMENFDMGNLNHKILELFIRDFFDKGEALPKVDENGIIDNQESHFERLKELTLKAIFDKQMDFRNSPLILTMLESQKEQIAGVILNFLQTFLKTYGGFYVGGVEKRISYNPKDKAWAYEGKIDNLLCSLPLEATNGQWQIIDYKNGGSTVPSEKACTLQVDDNGNKTLGDFQMPMYITLLRSESAKEIERVAFYSIKDTDSKRELVKPDPKKNKTMEDFEPVMEIFEEYVQNFDTKIKELNFSPSDNGITPWDNCFSCPYKGICRYSYTIAPKNIKEGN